MDYKPDKTIIAKRVAQLFKTGDVINLGIGLPFASSHHYPPQSFLPFTLFLPYPFFFSFLMFSYTSAFPSSHSFLPSPIPYPLLFLTFPPLPTLSTPSFPPFTFLSTQPFPLFLQSLQTSSSSALPLPLFSPASLPFLFSLTLHPILYSLYAPSFSFKFSVVLFSVFDMQVLLFFFLLFVL